MARDGEATLGPGDYPAVEVVGVEAGAPEGERGHRRARSRAALEDERPLRRQLRGALRQRAELEVTRARDVPRRALVVLAHVDQLRFAGRHQLRGLLGRELER